MTFRIPSEDKRLAQTNISDVVGNLYQTRNITLDEQGYIKLSHGTVSLYSEDNDADFDNVDSIIHGSSLYFAGGDLFRESNIELNMSVVNATATDTTPPSPGPENDGVFFNDTEVVSDGSTIKYNNAGTWTTISGTPTGTTGNPTALATFPAQNSLLVGRGNQVARVNTSWTVAVTLTLPAEYTITSIDVNGNYAYIVARHEQNGEAALFLWTGINTTNDGSYGLGTYGAQSVRKYGSSVVTMNSTGRLLQFNGSGFTELAALPVYYAKAAWGDASNDYVNITNRGMVVDGDLIYLNIYNRVRVSDKYVIPNMLGDIWCYDPKVGLYQKYSSTNNVVLKDVDIDTADINTTTDVITVSGIVVPPTGSPVFYKDGGTTIGGLIDEHWYYTIYATDTTLKLAKTYEDAMNGAAINITSASDNNILLFVKQYDYGQSVAEDQGAIAILNTNEYDYRQLDGVIFTTATRPTVGITAKWRMMLPSPKVRNLGYFVTPKMFSSVTEDVFNSVTLRFKPLKYGDKITVKYRVTEKEGFPCVPRSSDYTDNNVTWSSATTFTTVAAPAAGYYDFSNVAVGDEVEVINGAGSGFISKVSSISLSGYQYTVTLADSNPFIAANDTSMVKIDNWTTLEVIDGTTFSGTEKTIPLDQSGAWAQFKIVMEGVDVAVFDMIVDNKAFSRPR